MHDNLQHLMADPSFCECASAMQTSLPLDHVRALDDVFEQVRKFASVRRREVRVSLLQEAGRASSDGWQSHRDRIPGAVKAFGESVSMLSRHVRSFKPLISPALDDVIALASNQDHPLHKMLLGKAISLGFAHEEAAWLFNELTAIKCRPVQVVCSDGFEDLEALLAGISVGEGGLLLAGFVRFTGDPDTDRRLERLIIRLRDQGVTASIFLVLVIILTADAVMAFLREQEADLGGKGHTRG